MIDSVTSHTIGLNIVASRPSWQDAKVGCLSGNELISNLLSTKSPQLSMNQTVNIMAPPSQQNHQRQQLIFFHCTLYYVDT